MYGKPKAIRLENGPELEADTLLYCAKEHGAKPLFIQPHRLNQISFVKRFHRSGRTEVLDAYLSDAIGEVQDVASEWLTDHNNYRPR